MHKFLITEIILSKYPLLNRKQIYSVWLILKIFSFNIKVKPIILTKSISMVGVGHTLHNIIKDVHRSTVFIVIFSEIMEMNGALFCESVPLCILNYNANGVFYCYIETEASFWTLCKN